ncbi:MAG: pseudouridine synthase [Chloroflexota bacterium]
MQERLQKTMAAAGIGSRRTCEEIIRQGKVQVNGRVVTELGTKVDPRTDQILVQGKPIKRVTNNTYIKVYKPRDVLSDIGGDTRGRRTVADLVAGESKRLFSVGRLDFNSEGLVLLTDDGELANRITHPRYQHPKTYYVLVEKHPTGGELQQLRSGIKLPDGHLTAPAHVSIVDRPPYDLKLAPEGRRAGVWLKVILQEGKKRQIRHMTAAVGHPTLRLVRWSIGNLTLGELTPGTSVPLTRGELANLRELGESSASLEDHHQEQETEQANRRSRSSSRATRSRGRKSSSDYDSSSRKQSGQGKFSSKRSPRGQSSKGQSDREQPRRGQSNRGQSNPRKGGSARSGMGKSKSGGSRS